MHVCKNACMQVGMYYNMQLYNYASIHVWRYASRQAGKYENACLNVCNYESFHVLK